MNKTNEFSAERLERAIEKNGISKTQLAKKLFVDRSYITRYCSGKYAPNAETFVRMCSILNVTPEWLAGDPDASMEPEPKDTSKITVPILGRVAGGIPIEEVEDILGYEDLPARVAVGGAKFFALKIAGRSMEPDIPNGSIVICKKQDDVDSGQIAVAAVDKDFATCKRVLKYDDGTVVLQPLNPQHAPIVITPGDGKKLYILGLVCECRVKFNGFTM